MITVVCMCCVVFVLVVACKVCVSFSLFVCVVCDV